MAQTPYKGDGPLLSEEMKEGVSVMKEKRWIKVLTLIMNICPIVSGYIISISSSISDSIKTYVYNVSPAWNGVVRTYSGSDRYWKRRKRNP